MQEPDDVPEDKPLDVADEPEDEGPELEDDTHLQYDPNADNVGYSPEEEND